MGQRLNGRSNLHTEQLDNYVPTIRVADNAHIFVQRPRGERGALLCYHPGCDRKRSDPVHQTVVRSHPHMLVNPAHVCPKCGGPKDGRSSRCGPCARAEIKRRSFAQGAVRDELRRQRAEQS